MTDESVTAETPEKASRWEDYVDVFFSPAELFRRRAADRVAPPLLTLLGLALVFYFIMLPAAGIIMRVSLAENPQALEAMSGRTASTVVAVFGSIMVPITYLVILASTAALLWLVGRFADTRTDFNRTMLVATYAGFVMLLAQVAGNVAVLVHGEEGLDPVRHLSFGILRFIGSTDMDPMTGAILRRFEFFALWQAVLWAVGLREIYKISTGRAALISAITWALFVLPSIVMAALGFTPGGGGPGADPGG